MKDMSIAKKLLISNIMTILFSIVIALTALTGLSISRQYFIKFINNPYASSNQIKDCRTSVLYVSNYTNNIVNTLNTSQIPEYEAKVDNYKQEITKNLELLKTSYTEDISLLQNYQNAINDWLKLIDEVIDKAKSGNKQEAINLLGYDVPEALSQVTNLVIQLEDSIQDIVEESKQQNINLSGITVIITFIMLIISQIAIIIVGQKTRAGIINPLKEVEHASLELSKGNLNAELKYNSKNEIGNLAEATQSSIDNLRKYINDIDYVMNNLSNGNFDVKISQPFVGDFKNIEYSITNFIKNINDALKQINVVSSQVSTNASQISSGSKLLSEGSVEQASAVEQLSATIGAISEQVKQNASNALNAKEISQKSGIEAQNGNEQMMKMIDAMRKIDNSSKQINSIIKTIDNIAYQTNILALNAAIEAQRAGESGKGFAVVAEKVRRLASESIEAVQNTTALIENSINAIENGTKMADETAKSLTTILESTSQSVELVKLIANASVEQSDAINQVTESVDQIANVVQSNSNTAEESAQASQELFNQSTLLEELVNHFKLSK